MSAHVDDHQVVIALRDSATIMQLFGLRQPTVDVFRARSRDSVTQQATPVRVTYVAPDIPIPDSAFRVLAARRRRQYEASVSSIIRSIQIGDNRWGTSAWLELGDTVSLRVEELRCHFDACSGYSFVVRDSRWTIDDTSVADMRRSVDAFGEPSSYLRTNRPGTTRLRIDLPARASDTMPSREPPPRTLERLVVVTEPIARVEISPRPDTVRVGDHIAFRVRVIDRLGQELSAAPFELTVQGGAYNGIYPGPTPTQVAFDSAGARTLIGRMGKRADTLVLRVVEPRKR